MTSPNPHWKPGDTIASPVDTMVQVDPANVSPLDMYKLIIGTVVPRPIAFVSTVSAAGIGNLAPFSFFNGVSSKPPCLMISVSFGRDAQKKDTLINIEETGEFVVNSANEWLVEPLVHSAANFPRGVNEMERVGLTPIPSEKVKPARVKESAVHFECVLHDKLMIGDGSAGSAAVIFGRIVLVHIHSAAYRNGKIAFDQIKPVGRLGGFGYGIIGNTFEIPVPRLGEDGGAG